MKNGYGYCLLAGLAVLAVSFFGCKGGSGTGTYTATSGVAQKGPLLKGSLVTAQELDASLSPTGKQYSYQVDSDLGTFSPTSTFSSRFIGLNANGYYFDEVAGGISAGPVTLNGVSDLSIDTVLNVNLLTTLSYQRIINLVNNSNMTFPAARSQTEDEVLAALHIWKGSSYGPFGSLDISKAGDGDKMLAAISGIFVYGNSPGTLSSLIANFQSDIADNGVIDTAATVNALNVAAKNVSPASVASNLTQKYSSVGVTYTSTDISDWIDQDGDGVVGKFKFQVSDANESSTFTFPSFVASKIVGASISVTAGQLSINGTPATGAVTINTGDVISVTPAGQFPTGKLTTYLMSGTTKIARISFISGLQSISITPAALNLPLGLTQQIIASGTFSDNSTVDISTSVAWTSSAPAVATVNPSSGLARGVGIGSATITATSGNISGTVTLIITTPTLVSIAITPNTTGVGIDRPLTATGIYSDNSTANLTTSATWSSSAPSVATVNAGLVTGVALGSTTITATYGGIIGITLLNVTTDGWMTTASLGTARYDHSATLLPNGKVLITGGKESQISSVMSAEMYDPATATWSAASSPEASLGTEEHTATLLPNGKVMVVGGGWPYAQLYDPGTNTWSKSWGLAYSHKGHTATLLPNGKVLVVGGDYSTVDLYDPATDRWSTAANAPGNFYHTATLLPNGKVLMAGGFNTNWYLYDPSTDTWSTAGSFGYKRYNATATLLQNGKVLLAGGSLLYSYNSVASAELYDPSTNTWTAAGTTTRVYHTATLLNDGKVLLAGGSPPSRSDGIAIAEVYDPATNTILTAASLETARYDHTATLLPNGRVLVVGGLGVPGGVGVTRALASAELYW